ncbi:MAG: alcohol dehydrogenase catalytic domain-containing protein [Deltaproteobacteria bacterium]|nr:alcohol dehydrogenase catalytic domain-containing protein [Deltaproteobacteria bacterium]
MRALHFDGTTANVIDAPEPRPTDNDAVVRVALAGICKTDLELTKGYMGFTGILGHELVGVVEDGPAQWRGRRVVAEINFACGACAWCVRGLGRHCPTRRVMGIQRADGAFAERVAVPLANLHAVPDGVPDAAAVFAEPLAAAFEILEQVRVVPGLSCIVLGDGKLGLLAAQVLAAAGADVLAVGKHADKLAHLARRGVRTVELGEWTRGRADLVVEASGTAAGFELAVAATQPRGTLVLKSTVAHGAPLNLAPLVIDEITVVGSRCGPFAPALAALASGRVEVGALISARHALRDGVAALRHAAQPGVIKVLLEP